MAILDKFQDVYNYLFRRTTDNKKPNLGEDLRQVMQSSEFRQQWRSSSPFLVASLTAWPVYWLYRGYEWHKVRGIEPLPLYIKKTFFHAKLLEFGILTAAILMLLTGASDQEDSRKHNLQELVNKK